MLARPWTFHRKAWPALMIGALAAPVHAQTLGLAPSHEVSLWRVVGALVFCLILGAAGAFALRFRMRAKASVAPARTVADWRQLVAGLGIGARPAAETAGRLKLVETVRLGYQVEVNLVECDGKPLVIVVSPHGAVITDPDAPGKSGSLS